jgi:L-ascorbate metabolism protein UlaG (beta-lactamase superfamily)
MKITLYSFLMLLTVAAWAQRAPADVVQTSQGPLTIQPLQHATLALTWQGKTIYADPDGDAPVFQGIAPPDLILITDIHGDHFNLKTLEALPATNVIIVVPQAVADKMPEALKAKAVVLANGKTTRQLGLTIEAIPMYNLLEAADAKHTKGRGNGYIITFGDKKVYLSGDTAGIPEMRNLKGIDIAFVCMNLPYTMDVPEAASAVVDFKPKIVYPYHYRGANGLSDTEQFKKLVQDKNKSIDVRTRNWYPNSTQH